jgi:hypothetical protein
MKPVDREAMRRAIEMVRQEGGEPKRQIESMLRERPLEQVGDYAAYGQQCRSLRLRPWQWPPSWLRDAAAVQTALRVPATDHSGQRQAAELVQQLLSHNLSRYEPDPIGALSKVAEKEKSPAV